MQIELLGTIDYKKLKNYLKEKNIEDYEEIINHIQTLERQRHSCIVATAGSLSRFPGDVFERLAKTEENTFEQNVNFIKKVINMGHDSVTDHDYCVFALKDISAVIEQTIIAERFSSFTVKSRREVNFSDVGYYTPDFHDINGELILNNNQVKAEYQQHEEMLFKKYEEFTNRDIDKEDARFVLPYSYNSNIIMGVDAHTLKDMIIKYTKTKYSLIGEIREFGEKLYEIAKKNIPYIIDVIDKTTVKLIDPVDNYLESKIDRSNYKIIDKPILINHSKNIDDAIIISAIMRRYQFDYNKSLQVYKQLCNDDPIFKEAIIKKIAIESDALELTQINFEFQIPISFAVLTHITRHRTHHIMVPDFVPVVDLSQYKIPPKIKTQYLDEFNNIFKENKEMYEHFKNDYGIREEDLIYFTLSGNMVNIVTNMDGKTLAHILRLRECNKTQWETREISHHLHQAIQSIPGAEIFNCNIGPTCETHGFCPEGKESCGKILKLKQKQSTEL